MAHKTPLTFRIRISYHDENGLWSADCPDLESCQAFGVTMDEARNRILDVIGDRIHLALQEAKFPSLGTRIREKASQMTHRDMSETIQIGA